MRRTIYFLFFLFVFISPGITNAQQVPIANLVEEPKWEVGTDLLWLIDKNTLPKYSLLVRRKIGQHGAIRLRGGYLKNSNYMAFRQFDYNTASLIRIGYEYQKVLSTQKNSTKSLVYGGIDYFWRYENNYYYIWDIPNPAPYVGTGAIITEITHEQGGVLFIGYKYFVTRHLSLSAESSFQISHINYSQDERGFTSGYHAYNEFPRTSYQFLPLNTLTLSFHF
ncbi:hypothetical protein WBJ53_17735 [Spirosoma sp. SC4-14]|uniref:hypothetical protein n=1 Tax=Spirosoma sp. SC4-14 TaxID=3128900 RepID=UPI0030D0CF44